MLKRLSLPVQLVGIIIVSLLCGHLLPVPVVRGIFTISVFFKNVLAAILPFLVFSYVATGILSFRKNAPAVLAVLLGMVLCSNFFTACVAYFVTTAAMPWLSSPSEVMGQMQSLWTVTPYFQLQIPVVCGSEYALLAAIFVGITAIAYNLSIVERTVGRLRHLIELFLRRLLIPILPLYVFGFLLKIEREGVLRLLVDDYCRTFALMALLQVCVLFFVYALSQRFDWRATRKKITNALPSYITAFSTMSSTATIPVTLQSAEKNGVDESLRNLAVPLLANIHLLGDAISVPMLALVTMSIFTGVLPTFGSYLMFVSYFSVAMLAVAGIPGGGIMVMIPVLQSLLGFTPDMISVITTLYLVQDPLGTAGNVMGDGALVLMMQKVLKKCRLL